MHWAEIIGGFVSEEKDEKTRFRIFFLKLQLLQKMIIADLEVILFSSSIFKLIKYTEEGNSDYFLNLRMSTRLIRICNTMNTQY